MAEVKLDLGSLRRGTKKNGYVDWDDFIDVINSITTLITELKTDHAISVTLVTELKADLDANNDIFDAHSHEIDTTNTSIPSDEAAGTLNGTLVPFTPDVTAPVPGTLSAATPDTLALEN